MKKFSIFIYFFKGFLYVVLPNTVGALIILLYYRHYDFRHIASFPSDNYAGAFNAGAGVMAGIVIVSIFIALYRARKFVHLLKSHAEGETLIADDLVYLKRKVLNTPLFSLLLTVGAWGTAGIIFPLTMIVFGMPVKNAVFHFIGIVCIGGPLATVFTFLLYDSFARQYNQQLFPEGRFSEIPGVSKIPLYLKIGVFILLSGILPLIVLQFFSTAYIDLLENSEVNPSIEVKYTLLVYVVFAVSILVSILVSRYLSRHVADPLSRLEKAMKRVEKGDLNISLPVEQRDEIGIVCDGFNRMVSGLKQAVLDKGRLVSFDRELQIAMDVQRRLLTPPEQYREFKSADIDVFYMPFNKKVGGDYYNIDMLDDKTVSCMIADATGHGIHAALSSMQIDIMNSQSKELFHPDKRLEYINHFYIEKLKALTLFTAFVLNLEKGKVVYSSAGYPDQILVRGGTGEVRKLRGRGMVIGVSTDYSYTIREVDLKKGDSLLLFSDGIFEGFDERGKLFGEDRFFELIEFMAKQHLFENPMREVLNRIINAVLMHLEESGFGDDVTLIGIKARG